MKNLLFFTIFFVYINIVSGQSDDYFNLANPINDSPCMSDSNPPYDLGTSGTNTGTTCGAVGYNDDPNADKQNVFCSSLSDDNAVWYRAEYNPDFDGVNINITGDTIGNNTAVEVYVGGADAICDSTAEFRKAKCDGLPVEDLHIGCLDTGDYVWIKVTSSDQDCGTFNISVEPINDCDIADNCEDITSSQTLEPVTPDDISINYFCLQGCLDLACPDDIDGGCDFSQNPTVWYKINTDSITEVLYTTVTPYGNWTPVWSVWYSDPDCEHLKNAGYEFSSDTCNTESIPVELLIVGVEENKEYYISVSAAPNNEPIDDSKFDICVAATKTICANCIGDPFNCEQDKRVIWEITDRENKDAEPDGPPYRGPFCPGEKLNVHLEFHYDATNGGDEWLLGFIPKFGCGWDLDGFNYGANAPYGNGRVADWYTEDGPCPPLIMEDVDHLCTYTDADGHLRLINSFCEEVPPGITCSNGMNKYDPLPSGYFWVSEGHYTECNSNDCSPSSKFGIGTPVVDVTWDFSIKVKQFNNKDTCNNCDDLSIVFQTFSDGVAGCWEDPIAECLCDMPQFSPKWSINCKNFTTVTSNPKNPVICSGQNAGISVYTESGVNDSIKITFDDNPNVSGENEHIFPDGSGTIDDILTIVNADSCLSETITYYAQTIGTNNSCNGIIDTIKVVIYTLPEIVQDTIPVVSLQDLPYVLPIEIECGNSGTFSIEWKDNISGRKGVGDSIVIDSFFGIALHTFSITIANNVGCKNKGEIKFDIQKNGFKVDTDIENAQCFDDCNGAIAINYVSGLSKPLNYKWSTGDSLRYILNLCAGNYYVTISDSIGLLLIDTFVINEPEEILIFVDTFINITNAGSGSIITHTNYNENYIFKWTGPNGFQSEKQNLFGLEQAGCYNLSVIDTLNDCSADTTICIADKTGTIDVYDKLNIKIYPNPANDIAYFDWNEKNGNEADIWIYNIDGEKVHSFRIYSTDRVYTMNTEKLVQGLYIVKIISGNGIRIKTFVINR